MLLKWNKAKVLKNAWKQLKIELETARRKVPLCVTLR
jgi:hypothetical protein